MSTTRDNHYVPEWYQKGFLQNDTDRLCYLDLSPGKKELPNGRIITFNDRHDRHTSKCFYQTDLYTTFFGNYINDDVETFLFGKIDDSGARAIRAFIDTDMEGWHKNFVNFFSYIDTQKIRTPKGLDWIRQQYPSLSQLELMLEMQSIRNLHCTLWTEGVREIVSAENSDIKFIISDHPVTIYNYACPPDSDLCNYPNDPSIALNASQTIFPLCRDYCLILTNLEYAKNPDSVDPIEKRTHAKLMRQSMVRTDKYIRSRQLNSEQVAAINMVLKSRAKRYIAAAKEEWLYPEKLSSFKWHEFQNIFLPPKDELYHFGGEIYVGYKDGSTYHQDAYGREHPENVYLKKDSPQKKIGRNDPCGCGSGKKFKKCCEGKSEKDRPPWNVLSIRERNIVLYRGVYDILGLNKGKTWEDVRRELSNDQIVDIHNLYWSLWPIETDLISLLPKPDDTLRAVYTGLLDPRVIWLPLGAVPYFEEVIIQHPFVHPKAVKPEFSPIENPHQHKYQTLKNILLFLYLEPFIRSGRVNFIPDPCMFDNFLHRELLNMATERRGNLPINKKEAERYMELGKDDFARTMRGIPKEQLMQQIAQSSPELSQEEIDNVAEYMKSLYEDDPFALLQDDLYTQGGQLMMTSMSPNFEMALFTAQITGSAIITDSATRWEELNVAQVRSNGVVSYPWKDVSDLIAEKKFTFCADSQSSLNQSINVNCGHLRKLFRDLLNEANKNVNDPDIDVLNRYKNDFQKGFDSVVIPCDAQGEYLFRGKMSFLIPKGGFAHNNVQRLLLKSGSQKHFNKVA
ncbi:MAG: DUF4238 domain-containing protein, partial [Syntrophorhabdus sp.]